MANFQRAVKKAGIIERLEYQIEVMEQVEVRQLLVLACYEAVAGGIEPELVKRTNDMLHNKKFSNRAEMYQTMLSCAKSVLAELEYEAATRQPEAAPSTQGTEPAPAEATPPPEPDTAGTSA